MAAEAYRSVVQAAAGPLLAQKERGSWGRRRRNERPIEYAFTFRAIARHAPEAVLDVGPGKSAFPDLVNTCGIKVTAIDKVEGYWRRGMHNLHWRVRRGDITDYDGRTDHDLATCLSVLEHIPDHEAAVRGLAHAVRRGGHVVITTPFAAQPYHPNVYDHPDAAYGVDRYVCQSFSEVELATWEAASLRLVDSEFWQLFTGPYWTTGQYVIPARQVERGGPHQLGCFLFERI